MSNNISIVTWNVNSINARLENVIKFLNEHNPDVVLFQELKCMTEKFPYMEIEELGYNVAAHGQKTYNGVAIISKYPIDDIVKDIPNFEDENSRYIEGVICLNESAIRVASVYVPNGQQVGSEKFEYKLNFFDALRQHLANINEYEEKIVIGGDFNVAPEDIDVYDPISLMDTVCFHHKEQEKFRSIENLNYFDLYRSYHPEKQEFSWWDYRGGAWNYNKGLRIDFLLANASAADSSERCEIISDTRGEQKASDHAPVWCEIKV
jgi:exodeoxyribonuclease-3